MVLWAILKTSLRTEGKLKFNWRLDGFDEGGNGFVVVELVVGGFYVGEISRICRVNMCFCRNSFPARRMLFAKMRQTGISSPSTSATSANSWIVERKCKETRISVSRRAHASLRHSFNGRARVRDSSSRYSLNLGIVSRSCSFKAFTLYKAKGINDDFFRCYCLLCIDFPSCWVFFETRLLRVAFWTRFGGTSDSSLLV